MYAYLITMLTLHALGILGGLIFIATRRESKPSTPTQLAVRVFLQIVLAVWVVFLLAKGVANV